jgi:hypothetical protein
MGIPSQQRHAQRATESKAIGAFWVKAEKRNAEKLEAAKVILGDVAKYGGEAAGVVISARIVLRNEAEWMAAR